MSIRTADANWDGSLKEGKGRFKVGSGAIEGAYTFQTRFGEEKGTNPEELIAAAHAGCFSMALSADLGNAGFKPVSIRTTARVTLGTVDLQPRITLIELETQAKVAGIDDKRFQEIAAGTKTGCPISAALASVPIRLVARLVS